MNDTTHPTALAHADVAPRLIGGRDLILQADNLNAIVRVADMMANSKQAVPRHLRSNPGACLAVTMQAMRWNMDPFALATKTYTIDAEGPIAYEGQAIIAALNNSPLLTTRLFFEWGGPWEKIVGRFVWKESTKKNDENGRPKKYLAKAWDDNEEQGLYCTVTATLAGESQPRELQLFLMQARVRNSPLWVEDPRQQLAYLASRRWGRLYAPDVIMGVYTPDELAEAPEKFMGMADEVKPPAQAPAAPPPPTAGALQPWPDDMLEKRFPVYRGYLASGKTHDDLVAFAHTKGTLSEEQERRIRALQPAEGASDATAKPPAQDVPAAAQTGAPLVTYAVLANRMMKCDSREVAELILDEARALPDEQQHELSRLFAGKFGHAE